MAGISENAGVAESDAVSEVAGQETGVSCPNCGESAPDDAKWCEACGQELSVEPLPACVSCGEREVAEEGYCLSCGHKQPEERDHMVFQDGPVVAITDRGKRHRHNEDSVAIGSTPAGAAVMVVCDGVSSTPGSAEASLRAATAARDLLIAGLDDPAETALDLDVLMTAAVEAAQVEASQATTDESFGASVPYSDGGPPSSTFVAVAAVPTPEGLSVTTAWVGDSRAYWLGEEPRRLSTEDHELEGSLVRWLGADSIDPTADIANYTLRGPGHVVVCSDGMWRYADDAAELNDLVQRLTDEGTEGVDLAQSLVDHANDGGGHDNISVAVLPHQISVAELPPEK